MNKGGVSLHDVAIGIRNKLITDADLLSIAADASAKKRAKAKTSACASPNLQSPPRKFDIGSCTIHSSKVRQALSGLKSVAVSCSKDYTKNGLDDDENDENLENFTEKRTERKLFRSSPVKDHLDADGSLSLDFIRRNVGEDSESPRESMFGFMKTGFYDRAYDESESSDDDKSTSPKCQIPNYQPVDDIDSGLVLVTDSSNTSFDVEEKTVDNNVANDSDYYCEYEEEDSKELFSYDEIREQIIANVLKVFNNGLREELIAFRGIGAKRASFIIEEREAGTVFESLADLELIGLPMKSAKRFIKNNLSSLMDL